MYLMQGLEPGSERAGVAVLVAGMALVAACENPRPPAMCGRIAAQTVTVGEVATVSACFEDPNGDVLRYGAASSDPGVVAVSVSGTDVTVRGVAPGTGLVTITATDATQLAGHQDFTVTVPNRPPLAVGEIASRELSAGQSATVDVAPHFDEPDGQSVVYDVSVSDTGVASASVAGSIVTVAARAKGVATVTVTAVDPGGMTAAQSFVVTVPNRAPAAVGSVPEQTVEVGRTATIGLTGYFSDPDGDELVFTAASSATGVATVSISGNELTVLAVAKGLATVTVTAADTEGLTAAQSFPVTAPNRAPVPVGSIADQTVEVGEAVSLELSGYFSDPDGDELLFFAAVSEAGSASVEISGGVLTVTAVAKGVVEVTVTAIDPEELEATQAFAVTVPNRAPVADGAIGGRTIAVGETAALDLSGHFRDPDGDGLVYAAESSATEVAGVAVSGDALTVTAVAKGTATVSVTATDTEGLTATQEFTVTVPNRAPVAEGSIEGRTIEVGDTDALALSGYFSDPDGDVLAYTVESSDPKVAGARMSGVTLTVTALAKGTSRLVVAATDPEGQAATHEFTVTVPNRAPLPAAPIRERTVEAGETAALQLAAHFTDPDGDILVFAATSSDAAVAVAKVSRGELIVTAAAKGTATVTVTATDNEGLAATQAFTVTVPNRPPLATDAIGDRTIEVGRTDTLELARHFGDPDGDALTHAVTSSDGKVVSAAVDGGNLVFTAVARGVATVTVKATDPEGLAGTQAFRATVPNRPPVATGAMENRTLEVGETATLDLSRHFTDPDGDALSYTASASGENTVGVEVSGGTVTVTALAKGAGVVEIRAADPEGLAATLTWTVSVPNRPPQPTGVINDATIAVGGTLNLELPRYFSDPDGDELTYTVTTGSPEVAAPSVSGGTAEVRAVARGRAEVTVAGTDPEGLSATRTFTVTVPNRTPTAVGAVPKMSLKKGGIGRVHPWSYFSDPDDDALVYDATSWDVDVAKAWVARNGVVVRGMDKGKTTVILTAKDTGGLFATLLFEVRVDKSGGSGSNRRPKVVGSVGTQTLEPDASRTLNGASYFDDPDDDPLTYSASSSDADVVKTAVSGSRITLDAVAEGAATVTIRARDPGGLAASLDFEVTVVQGEEPNRAPVRVGRILDQSLETGDRMRVNGSSYFTDPDGDELTFSAGSSDDEVVTAKVSGSEVTFSAEAEGTATVTVTATDPDGLSVASAFEVTVVEEEEENRPPKLLGRIPAQDLQEGDARKVKASSHFTDPDGDELTFSAESSDDETVTAKVSGSEVTLDAVAAGTATITITARDPDELSASQNFEVTVSEEGENRPPTAVGRIPAQTLVVDEESSVDASSRFTDPDGDELTFSAESSDDEAVTAKVSGSKVTLGAVAAGTATITVTARDPDKLSASQNFEVTVSEEGENRPPAAVGRIPAQSLEVDEESSVDVSSRFADPDDDELTFSARSSDAEVVTAKVSGSEVTLTGVAEGTATVTITAKDPDGLSAASEVAVTVSETEEENRSPKVVGQILAQELEEGDKSMVEAASYFNDPDDDELEFSAESADTEVVEAAMKGTEVELKVMDEGTTKVKVMAKDPKGLEASQEFGVTVKAVVPNKPPRVKKVPFWDVYWGDPVLEGVTLKVVIEDHFFDPDDDYSTLTVTAESTNEAVVSIESVTRDTVKLLTVSHGWASVTVTVTDPDGRSASKRWGVKVEDVAPDVRSEGRDFVIAVDEETTRSFRFYFIDCNIGDSLTFTLSNSNPAALEASVEDGLAKLKGLATGETTIRMMAEDRTGLTAEVSFTVTVDDNRPPVILDSIPKQMTVTLGDTLRYVLTEYFEDPDGDDLTFSAISQRALAKTLRGDTLWLVAVKARGAYFSVTATDPDGRSVWQSSAVTVEDDSDMVSLPGLPPGPMIRPGPVARVVAVADSGDFVDRDRHPGPRAWLLAYRPAPRRRGAASGTRG